MREQINDDMLENVSGGGRNPSKEDLLKEIAKIQERIRTETNPTTLMKLNAELKRLKMLYDALR